MFIAREPMSLPRRSEERKIKLDLITQVHSAPPNGTWCSWDVPVYKRLTPTE